MAGYVESLLHDRQPARFPAELREADLLQVAAELRSLRSGVDLPRQEFIEALRQRLAAAAGSPPGADTAGRPADARRRQISRREVLAAGGAAAAALVAGVALDRALSDRDATSTQPPSALLSPQTGRWVAVAALAALADGAATRFTAGAIEGFLVRRGDAVEAISAVCTHMGCILRFNPAGRRLDCPCHGASFALDGNPLNREYLTALPRLRSRLSAGSVEVWADA